MPKGTGVSLDSTTNLKALCGVDMTRSRDSANLLDVIIHLKPLSFIDDQHYNTIPLPRVVFAQTHLHKKVSNNNAQSGRDEGDDDAFDQTVEISGGHVDKNVSPGKGHGHNGVEK